MRAAALKEEEGEEEDAGSTTGFLIPMRVGACAVMLSNRYRVSVIRDWIL
jgi:hypothetical protein